MLRGQVRGFGCVAALVCASTAGCSQPTFDVSGRVTKGGRPMAVGSVVLFAPGSAPVVAPIRGDGTYTVAAVPVPSGAAVRVAVFSENPEKDAGAIPPGPAGAQDRAVLADLKQKWFPIPARYNNPERSGLSFNPAPPAIQYDIDIKP
jgi:hypothetical protein